MTGFFPYYLLKIPEPPNARRTLAEPTALRELTKEWGKREKGKKKTRENISQVVFKTHITVFKQCLQ